MKRAQGLLASLFLGLPLLAAGSCDRNSLYGPNPYSCINNSDCAKNLDSDKSWICNSGTCQEVLPTLYGPDPYICQKDGGDKYCAERFGAKWYCNDSLRCAMRSNSDSDTDKNLDTDTDTNIDSDTDADTNTDGRSDN